MVPAKFDTQIVDIYNCLTITRGKIKHFFARTFGFAVFYFLYFKWIKNSPRERLVNTESFAGP